MINVAAHPTGAVPVKHVGTREAAAGLLARGGRRGEAAALLAEALERYE